MLYFHIAIPPRVPMYKGGDQNVMAHVQTRNVVISVTSKTCGLSKFLAPTDVLGVIRGSHTLHCSVGTLLLF